MSKTFRGDIIFPNNFDVQTTRPLDDRLVVDSKEDLTNGTIDAPYQGMVVNIKGTSELWVLMTDGIANSRIEKNWRLVTGVGGGGGLSKHSLPVMTKSMADDATADSDIDFDSSEDPYIEISYDPLATSKAQNDVYMDLIYDMTNAIKALQAEVTRLKNTFIYGIDSYKNQYTAKTRSLYDMDDIESEEPLWAIDPGMGLILVPDNIHFNTLLDENHTFVPIGDDKKAIDVSVEGQLTFNDCKGVFYDGNEAEASDENLTLYKIDDSKLITYLVTDKPTINMTLISLDNKNTTREIDFAPLLGDNVVNRYGFCVVISRQQKINKSQSEEQEYKGFNYIYFSIINYDTDAVLAVGYLDENGTLSDTRVDTRHRYSIKSIEFDRLTLSRMKFYTKFEDFTEEIIPMAPKEDDWKYDVAHIAIRSVKDTEMLNSVSGQLKNDELVWNKKTGTLHIKSDGKIYTIGSKSKPDDEDNKDNYMTDREIIEALKRMGIVVNVSYKIDPDTEEETDEIESVSNMSLAPIADVTFINQDTNKKFTFTVDPEGNLVGKDKSVQTIDEFLGKTIADTYKNPSDSYKAVRGFSSDFLLRKKGSTNISSDLNYEKDNGKQSDRLRISSFYAPIVTDERHGCTHSFIELENTSPVDIPLTGVYLHFFNPAENTYVKENGEIRLTSNKVHHLELDGVIKAGGTYLIRGAKHAEFEDESAFIKVRTYDKEWYENGELISFEQKPGNTSWEQGNTTTVPRAYRFCLTYGLSDLGPNKQLVEFNNSEVIIGTITYKKGTFPNIIKDPRFIDSCSYSTVAGISSLYGSNNPWYANGGSGGNGITIAKNSMFRLMFALDPAKQAFNGFNTADSSRSRYNKATDIQILDLNKEYIGFSNSKEIINIERYTPKASFENRNVMTDKTQLNREKPNMVTCSFGVDVYNTRCFNWISCGTFDEYVWLRKKGETKWTMLESYKKVSEDVTESTSPIHRKEYSVDVNNTVYARMINRFPGNDVLFTAHKCVVVVPDASTVSETYEYVVGRSDKDNQPDLEHTNSIYTFTIYPRSYEGRVYQITDQQGFHWIEYQVWAASAEFLNTQIDKEVAEWNSKHSTKVFPILINTGDMTQSGARINEWLDYYNGGISLFNHLEQMNCVGNNDLCPINPRDLGTGNDSDKSSSQFFHYFYCYDLKDNDEYNSVNEDKKKFFSGDAFVVKAHTGSAKNGEKIDTINVTEDKYIPSFYYFKTGNVLYIIVNSEIPFSNCQKWFGLCSNYETSQYVNVYTGIEAVRGGRYAMKSEKNTTGIEYFTPLYETMYTWLDTNNTKGSNKRKVIVAMHEMPFTVITNTSLKNDNSDQLPCTRNHPTKAGRLGSNVNQLNIDENRGIYWCSRLLEYFNCKLVIGGHKHTYALSYPIKEKYTWSVKSGDGYSASFDSSDSTIKKPMVNTLEDESGVEPDVLISWDIDLSGSARDEYGITDSRTSVPDNIKLNSTKTPYIPQNLYNIFGSSVNNDVRFRCCTPIAVSNEKYDGFVTYSMCQATGYKLKSNKELPSMYQVFSKIIPQTTHNGDTDSPSGNQLYPMYSVLEFNDSCSELNVTVNRITNIFASNGKDKFDQLNSGKNTPDVQKISIPITEDGIENTKKMYGVWVNENKFYTDNREYLHIIF